MFAQTWSPNRMGTDLVDIGVNGETEAFTKTGNTFEGHVDLVYYACFGSDRHRIFTGGCDKLEFLSPETRLGSGRLLRIQMDSSRYPET